MDPEQEVNYILADCFLAVGRAIGTCKRLDHDAVVWWRQRYRRHFLHALVVLGNSWSVDRERLAGVGYYLGCRALHHAGEAQSIDLASAMRASDEIEAGCRMNALRGSGLPGSIRSSGDTCGRSAEHGGKRASEAGSPRPVRKRHGSRSIQYPHEQRH
jgi:hypothetical protein